MITIISTFQKDELRVALVSIDGSGLVTHGTVWRKEKLAPINLKLHTNFKEASDNYADLMLGFGSTAHESFMDVKELTGRRPEFTGKLVGFIDDFDDWETPKVKEEKTLAYEPLKASCYYCQDTIYALQRFIWNSDKYEIDLNCNKCKRKDTIKLSQEEIKKANEGGGWQAFLGK